MHETQCFPQQQGGLRPKLRLQDCGGVQSAVLQTLLATEDTHDQDQDPCLDPGLKKTKSRFTDALEEKVKLVGVIEGDEGKVRGR